MNSEITAAAAKALAEPRKKKAGAKGASKAKGKVREMRVKRGASGGFIAKHELEQDPKEGMYREPEEHPIADIDALHDHIDQHFGDQPEQEQAPQ